MNERKFQYCDECLGRENQCECKYLNIITNIFGGKYQHDSCPDQKDKGKSGVDMHFSSVMDNNDIDTIELEVKSINIGFEGTEDVAHKKFIERLKYDLEEVANRRSDLIYNLKLKRGLTDRKYKDEILNKIVAEIKIADFDYLDIPRTFENNYCKITIDYKSEKFNEYSSLFATSPPLLNDKPKDVTLKEILDNIHGSGKIIQLINMYLSDKKVRDKYKENKAKKGILFVIKHNPELSFTLHALNSAIPIYNQILERVVNSIANDPFFYIIIIAIEIGPSQVKYTTI